MAGKIVSVASEIRRAQALVYARKGLSDTEIANEVGVSLHTLKVWCQRYPDFKDAIAASRTIEGKHRYTYDGSFVSFRRLYLKTDTPPFQAILAKKIEDAQEGEVTMILMPPEHGKTTLLEDWCTYKLATEPSFRITVASANVEHPKKVLARVRNRLEMDGPFPDLVTAFGPFAPDSHRSAQVWGQQQFNVQKRKIIDERDYSMKAIGVQGSVQGTRCDLLLIDDVQSLKDLDQTEKRFEVIRQDFISRPSVFGRTVVIGTRCGEVDFYRRMIQEGVVDHLVTFPAYSVSKSPHWGRSEKKPVKDDPETHAPEGTQFLWPERYTPYQYATLRYRVGEVAWARNYMQHPEAVSQMTFDEPTTTEMYDDTRSVLADPRPLENGDQVPIVVSVDPAIGGGNAIVTAAMRPRRLEILNISIDFELTKYAQIIDLIEEECHRYSTPDSYIAILVVEDKAFQRGLLRDDRIAEVQTRFDFRIVPNTTGREKADPDIGVPSMPLAMQRGQITIPWSDGVSRDAMQPLLDNLHIWRPNVNGVKLEQDLTMALWFAYRQWRAVRHQPAHLTTDTSDFSTKGSPLRKATTRKRRSSRPYRRLGTYRGLR